MAVGAMTILGRFGGTLGLDTSDYARGIINADAVTRLFGGTFATFLTNPLTASLEIFKQVGRAALRMADEVLTASQASVQFSQQTGISTTLLQALRGELELVSGSGDKAEIALAKFVTTLGKAQQGDAGAKSLFERLGLDPDDLDSADQAFAAVIEKISRLRTEQDRLAFASVFFGEEDGRKIISAVGGGIDALGAMIQRQRDLGAVSDEETLRLVANLQEFKRQLESLVSNTAKRAVEEFLAGFATNFDTSTESAHEFGRTLQAEILPAAKELGENTGRIAKDLETIANLIKLIKDIGIGQFGYGPVSPTQLGTSEQELRDRGLLKPGETFTVPLDDIGLNRFINWFD